MHRFFLPLCAISALAPFATTQVSPIQASRVPGDMFIQSCSLGCTNGQGGAQVSCSIVNTFQNQDIAVLFSEPVDPLSVNAASFRIVKIATGTTPTGSFLIDPLDPRRLTFRPALTFDALGNPVFGLEPNTAYQITIPGTAQGDSPPFIAHIAGGANQSRLSCVILTDQGVQDFVPGDPVLETTVDLVDPSQPDGILEDQPAFGAVDVSLDSDIELTFFDIMNPATLVDPSTGQSTFITIEVDPDGNLLTLADRLPVAGSFAVELDLTQLETRLVFTPSKGLPPAGNLGPLRAIVVNVPPTVTDMVGNPVLPSNGGGQIPFFTVRVPPLTIDLPEPGGEPFDDLDLQDPLRTGAAWGGGMLQRGFGGGSGRLGDLRIESGATLVLDTESQTFPLPGQPNDLLGNGLQQSIEVTDGAFEFNTVLIEPGGSLVFEGQNPVRLYARGVSFVAAGALIDLSGGSAPMHDSSLALPVLDDPFTQQGGSGAGDGGFGADRFDHSANFQLLNLHIANPDSDAIENPGAVTDGRDGAGVGGTSLGRGLGGKRSPLLYPTTVQAWLATHGLFFNLILGECLTRQVGGAGSGGAYSLDGEPGHALSTEAFADFPAGSRNFPPPTPGGDAASLGLAPPNLLNTGYIARALGFVNGHLRGGSGGGGSGNHPYLSGSNGAPTGIDCGGPFSAFVEWHDHSGCAGGGGGGALQHSAGSAMRIDGVIDASGGDGGSSAAVTGQSPFGGFAIPGGGGSGGAVKLQSPVVELDTAAGRIDVSGGQGGVGVWNGSSGGAGSPGLVRIEDSVGNVTHELLWPSLSPADGPNGIFGQWSVSFLSAAPGFLGPQRDRPDAFSGAASCWIQPEGPLLQLIFARDSTTSTAPADQGWNMDVIWQPPGGAQVSLPFRGDNPVFINSFEETFGNLINHDQPAGTGSPVAVRFQGAYAVGTIGDPCDSDVDGVPAFLPGSLTPWVEHPVLLNDFTPRPNVVRFTVVFDSSLDPQLVQSVRGVTNLRISATLD